MAKEAGEGREENCRQARRCESGQAKQDDAEVAVRQGREAGLLSGGNPQIAKAYRDAPVQAYIAAMPGWKRNLGRRLDALIARAVPGVRPLRRTPTSPMISGPNADLYILAPVRHRDPKHTAHYSRVAASVLKGLRGMQSIWLPEVLGLGSWRCGSGH